MDFHEDSSFDDLLQESAIVAFCSAAVLCCRHAQVPTPRSVCYMCRLANHTATYGRVCLKIRLSKASTVQALHIAPAEPQRTGIDTAVISSFPVYTYKVPAAPDVETGKAHG